MHKKIKSKVEKKTKWYDDLPMQPLNLLYIHGLPFFGNLAIIASSTGLVYPHHRPTCRLCYPDVVAVLLLLCQHVSEVLLLMRHCFMFSEWHL